MRAFPCLAAILAAAAPALSHAAGTAPQGEWDSPVGRIRVQKEGQGFVGRLVAPAAGCPLQRGDKVLRGTVVDDSLAGQLQICLAGAGCPAQAWASTLLLIGERRLSGAVHVAEKGCRASFGKNGGLTLTRPKPSTGAPSASPQPPGNPPVSPEARARAVAVMRDGQAWLREGDVEKARERFLEAVEIAPGIPEAYNGVGVTYRARNDLPQALAWYKKALGIDPDFGDAYYNMACVYALQGERTLALRYLQIAAMNGYVTAEGVDTDDDLASIRTTREYRALRDRM